ncbi:hypothetical protein [Defluviimonas sp. WL0075]|uniref:Lysozyme inhibitor LprI N-terminal domain-containing protein n=1 Tax=Albidovulum sediminicola TaxID=2984331 RepID=A0ABT2Z5F1_9RHOB|nr:hypothetical protein [Defluviimonas sp. WL0075]MCV2866011.1 hypothetical protein [Defluviimonas sp. WL0075]
MGQALGRLILALILGAAATPAAAQPLSQSMSECAALYELTACQLSDPDRAARLSRHAAAWSDAATDLARAEGRADPQGFVLQSTATKYAEWDAKGALWLLSGDFRDWAAYCRSLGRSRGLDFELN